MMTAGRAMNSPWAKLIAPAVCHSRANPTAARAKIAPVASPEKVIWTNVDMAITRNPQRLRVACPLEQATLDGQEV